MTPNDADVPLLARQEAFVAQRFEKNGLERIRPLITQKLVEEHRRNPIGIHSLNLEFVLGYIRRHGNPDMDRLLVFATKPEEEFHILEHPTRAPAKPMTMREKSYPTRAEINHQIFLERLKMLGLEIQA